MAEAILNRLGGGKFHAYSAGSFPKDEVHPFTLDLLQRQNFPIHELKPKVWDVFAGADAPDMDFVFTVCDRAAGEACPVWPGQPISAHWGFPDPAAFDGKEGEKRALFEDVFRMITQRLELFVSLPFESLDRLALEESLERLGHT